MPKILEIEATPNPNAKKFVLKDPLTVGNARSYENVEQARDDKLAAALFAIPHVVSVYYVDRWLTVTQDGGADWNSLLKQLAVPIREAVAEDVQSQEARAVAQELPPMTAVDEERLEQINAFLDVNIRPYLMRDGGNLEIVGIAGNRLLVHYQGACGTCPSAISGTLAAIESHLQAIEPELEVVAV